MKLRSPSLCVITGAGSGLGRAFALELAERGCSLVLADIDLQAVEESATLAKAKGAMNVKALRCDVSKLPEIEMLAQACVGPIHLLINNAGVSTEGAVGTLSLDDWNWTLGVNFYGVIYGCHVFAPILKKQNHGHILNISSAASFGSLPNMAAYNVSKASVVSLSETLAFEFKETGVGVTVVCPSFFKTNIARSGRYQDETMKEPAIRLIDSGPSAQKIARAALKAVEKNQLYCLPTADIKFIWRVKRFFPHVYFKFASWAVKAHHKNAAN